MFRVGRQISEVNREIILMFEWASLYPARWTVQGGTYRKVLSVQQWIREVGLDPLGKVITASVDLY